MRKKYEVFAKIFHRSRKSSIFRHDSSAPPPLNFKFAREKLLQTDGGTCRVIITYQKAFWFNLANCKFLLSFELLSGLDMPRFDSLQEITEIHQHFPFAYHYKNFIYKTEPLHHIYIYQARSHKRYYLTMKIRRFRPDRQTDRSLIQITRF